MSTDISIDDVSDLDDDWVPLDPDLFDRPNVTAGRFEATDHWAQVPYPDLPADEQAVMIASVATNHGGNTAGVRMRNVGTGSMEAFIEEEQSADQETSHDREAVRFVGTTAGPIRDGAGSTIGEAGTVEMRQPDAESWRTVSLSERYDDPVVFAQVMSYEGRDPCHARVRSVQSDSFEVKIEEWSYLNGPHTTETVGYVVIERGAHELGSGAPIEVRTATATDEWTSGVEFDAAFAGDPAVVSRSQTENGDQEVVTRQRNVSAEGVDVRLQEEEGRDGKHTEETVGILATPRTDIDVGFGHAEQIGDRWSGVSFESRTDEDPVALSTMETFNGSDTAAPQLRQLSPDGAQVRVEEETSGDEETQHANETVSVVSLPSGRLWDADGTLIGEAGQITTEQPDAGTWHAIEFAGRYDDPVVFAEIMTHNGGDPSHVRLRNVGSASCEFQIEEWDYLDGQHTEETIGYFVVEAGVHELNDGATLDVGTTATTDSWGNAVGFDADFRNKQPALLTQCQTRNGAHEVVTRAMNLEAGGFDVRLQEEEGRNGKHTTETVGYLGIARPNERVPDYQVTLPLDQHVEGFRPSTCGFEFPNDFPSGQYTLANPIGPIDEIGDTSNGMCGGMVLAARDYFEAGISPWSDDLRDRNPPNSPVSSDPPAEDTPLFDFLSERLFDSFEPGGGNPFGAGLYQTLMNSPNTEKSGPFSNFFGAKKSRNEVMRDHWEGEIKPALDNDTLCPLGLIHVDTHGNLAKTGLNQIGNNHQVLAYGYNRSGDDIEIYVYDPNAPDSRERKVTFTKKDSLHNWYDPEYVGTSDPLYAFFAVPYSFKQPPTF